MNLLLIPLVLASVVALLFVMAWLEQKQFPPTQGATSRRTAAR